jgi:peptidyl-prolyl cis-trans isomerase SurA
MMALSLSWMPAIAGLCVAAALWAGSAVAVASTARSVDRIVAIVNTEVITERELVMRTDAIRKRIQREGGALPPEDLLREQVLEKLVNDSARLQAARSVGITIDDVTIDRTLSRIAADAGRSPAEFQKGLAADGIPLEVFRQELAVELAMNRIRERDVDSRVQVSEAEVDAWLEEQKTAAPQINLAQILVPVPEGATAEQQSRAAELAARIARGARSGADFGRIIASYTAAGERISGGVMGLRPLDMVPELFVQAVRGVAAGESSDLVRSPVGFHVLRVIERRGASATMAAPVRQTRARHILARVDAVNPEVEVQRRLAEVRGRIQARAVNFADMARQYSADGSAAQGGELGWLYAGDTVPEFEAAMNALEPGEVSEPVRTPFGFHLIEVLERRTDSASPERLRAQARSVIRTRKSAEAFEEWVSLARDRAFVQIRLDER